MKNDGVPATSPAPDPSRRGGAGPEGRADPTDEYRGNDVSQPEHFKGCHPEDEHDPTKTRQGYVPQETEPCWHCGTPTVRGCDCYECWEYADDVPPESTYHCPTCRRWWAYMIPRITTIVFPGTPE